MTLKIVHHKVYEGLALCRCVVADNSPAMRRLVIHGQQVWLCDRADPSSLA